jgi:hypothetical protein
LNSCGNGNVEKVREILNSIKDFNIDITDKIDKSALRIAIEKERVEVNNNKL